MKKKLSDQLIRSRPHARMFTRKRATKPKRGLGVDVYIVLNGAATVRYGLKHMERVDIFWDKFNKLWERPVLTIKRGGTQRSLSGTKNSKWLRVAMTQAVLELGVPILKGYLPILDYIDNEIWIDFSDTYISRDKGKNGGKEARSERLSLTQDHGTSLDLKWTPTLLEKVKVIAKEEGISRNLLVIKCVELYIEKSYPELRYMK